MSRTVRRCVCCMRCRETRGSTRLLMETYEVIYTHPKDTGQGDDCLDAWLLPFLFGDIGYFCPSTAQNHQGGGNKIIDIGHAAVLGQKEDMPVDLGQTANGPGIGGVERLVRGEGFGYACHGAHSCIRVELLTARELLSTAHALAFVVPRVSQYFCMV